MYLLLLQTLLPSLSSVKAVLYKEIRIWLQRERLNQAVKVCKWEICHMLCECLQLGLNTQNLKPKTQPPFLDIQKIKK